MPSSPHGPCSTGNTTSTSPSVLGGSPGASTRRARSRVLSGTQHTHAAAVDLGRVPGREVERSRVVGDEDPAPVLGDADRHDVVGVPVDGPQDARGAGARHRMLGGATAEDDGDAWFPGGLPSPDPSRPPSGPA